MKNAQLFDWFMLIWFNNWYKNISLVSKQFHTNRKQFIKIYQLILHFAIFILFTHMKPLKKIIICNDKDKLYDKMNKLFMFMSKINAGQIKQNKLKITKCCENWRSVQFCVSIIQSIAFANIGRWESPYPTLNCSIIPFIYI